MVGSIAVIAFVFGLTSGAFFGSVPAATAAPGDAFDPSVARAFVAQGPSNSETYLNVAVADSSGTVHFERQGGATPFGYNAIGYNEDDDYIYGIASSDGGGVTTGDVVKIGQENTLVDHWSIPGLHRSFLAGAMDGDILYLFRPISIIMIDVATRTGTEVVRPGGAYASPHGQIQDWTFAGGFLWAAVKDGVIIRFDPKTATDVVVPGATAADNIVPSGGTFGAAWTLANGNLAFSNNGTGQIVQVHVNSPASGSPTFSLISTQAGPSNAFNDGTSSLGPLVDLGVTKTAPGTFVPGDTVDYRITVTNHSAYASSGSVVHDTLPAGVSVAGALPAGCTASAPQTIRCTLGTLAAGASHDYTIHAATGAAAHGILTNTVTVTGNEKDPNAANDTATATSTAYPLAVTKTSDAPGTVQAGDVIHYSVTVTNRATSARTAADPASVVDDLSGILDDATYNNDATFTHDDPAVASGGTLDYDAPNLVWTGPLGAGPDDPATTGNSVTITYSVTVASGAGGDGDLRNIAYVPSGPVGPAGPTPPAACDAGFGPDGEACAVTRNGLPRLDPAITVVKSAQPDALRRAGQSLTYSFVVTNTGNATLRDVTVVDRGFTGSGPLGAVHCPQSVLAPGAQETCTAAYTVTQADVDSGQVANAAYASATPPSGPAIQSPPSTVTTPNVPQPAVSVVKSAAPADPADYTVGRQITYAFLVTNTGNVTMRDATVVDTGFTGTGKISAITCPAGARRMLPGAKVTCTATYTLTAADIDAGKLVNGALASATSPSGTVVTSPASSMTVPGNPQPQLAFTKSADTRTVTHAGQTVGYAFTVTNVGAVTLRGVHPVEKRFSGTGSLSRIDCPPAADRLAPGDAATCTATYRVTAGDLAASALVNTAFATGTAPAAVPAAASGPVVSTLSGVSIAVSTGTAQATTPPGTGATVNTGGTAWQRPAGGGAWSSLGGLLLAASAALAWLAARERRRG